MLPLVFNLVRSLLILRQLKATIPADAKQFFHFVIDPVGGTVAYTCSDFSVNALSTISNQWSSKIDASQGQFNPQLVSLPKATGLTSSWMSFLSVKPTLILSSKPPYPRRCVVDFSMYSTIIPLLCRWSDFVFIALAMGVEPTDTRLLQLRNWKNLKSHETEADMTLLDKSGRSLLTINLETTPATVQFCSLQVRLSLRRALAWDLVMAFPHSHGVEIIPLVQPAITSSGIGRDFPDTPNALGLAVTWTLYAEHIRHLSQLDDQETLPSLQSWLKIRLDAVQSLRNMSKLNSFLQDIFPNNGTLVDQIGKMLAEQERDAEKSNSPFTPTALDIWPNLVKNDVFLRLQQQFHPSPKCRIPRDIDLENLESLEAVLARVLILTSCMRGQKKLDWHQTPLATGEMAVEVPENPLATLNANGSDSNPLPSFSFN